MTGRYSGRPVLPPKAETEILELLYANMEISSGEIAAILKKHQVAGDMEALQDSYRKRLGQQKRVPTKPALWEKEEQGSVRSFRRQVETELSGLCDDAASIRDDEGRREVLANGRGRYVVLECCGDRRQLKSIRRRIQGQMKGLNESAGKVQTRVRVLDRLKARLSPRKQKKAA